jgi:hypothetical protein
LALLGDNTELAQQAQEGGVKFLNLLLSVAIPLKGEDPINHTNVWEWTYHDIECLPSAQQKEWRTACQEELNALEKRKVFEYTNHPEGWNVIWVFDVKSDSRKKARLVAKGFSQVEGIDYDQIFSPVVWFETLQIILALAAIQNWEIKAVDVRDAYLYGKLNEEIYMEQPEGFKVPGREHWVLQLWHALYGLKQAGLSWWNALSQSMSELGFKHLRSDEGIFVYHKHNQTVVTVVYVDDAFFWGSKNSPLVNKLKDAFIAKWECRELDGKEFLCMRITWKGWCVYLDQCAYLEKVLKHCNMENAQFAPTPLPEGYISIPNDKPVDLTLWSRFQTVIGLLLYLMIGTHPDIAFAVTALSRHSANPSQDHLNKALYICRYLIGTKDYSLKYDGQIQGSGIIACTDSD